MKLSFYNWRQSYLRLQTLSESLSFSKTHGKTGGPRESKLSLGLPGLSVGLPELSLGLPCTFHGSPKLSEAPRGRKSILTSRRMILWEHRTRSEQDRNKISRHSVSCFVPKVPVLAKRRQSSCPRSFCILINACPCLTVNQGGNFHMEPHPWYIINAGHAAKTYMLLYSS